MPLGRGTNPALRRVRLGLNIMILSHVAAVVQPTDDHIAIHRSWARLRTDEQLLAAIADAEWLLLTDAEVDSACPADVDENTRLNQLAVIEAANRELAFRSRRGLSRSALTYTFSREFLDDLKARVRIEDEVGMAISLQRHGSVIKGCCPFHDDHDPSLIIWPDRQHWWCFPCNAGGDVLTWVQAWMPTDFHGAVVYLAARAGVSLPTTQPTREIAAKGFRTREVPRG